MNIFLACMHVIMYVCVSCMHVHHICAWYYWKSEESVIYYGQEFGMVESHGADAGN